MKTIMILLIFFFLSNICYGQSNLFEEKQPIHLNSVGSFYDDQPTGSIAFLPGVGKEEYFNLAYTHLVLPESGFYKLPQKGNYFFRVNHKALTEETSYLGVTVYLIYPLGTGQKRSFHLTRNEANWQPGENRKLARNLNGPKYFPCDIKPFFDAHKPEQNSLKQCDEILTFTWHAAVETGAYHSWDYKDKWNSSKPPRLSEFLKILQVPESGYNVALTAYILHFTTSRKPKLPLYFWFNADAAAGAYISVFSPLGPEFDKEFYFKFE